MKLPRDLSGTELAKRLAKYGYEITRQTGSHIRLTTLQAGEHHLTIPAHTSLSVGTLAAILTDVSEHAGIGRDKVLSDLGLTS
jgi:predicted RNA binding protein YcfA (HicA-like mRNA interferase family)